MFSLYVSFPRRVIRRGRRGKLKLTDVNMFHTHVRARYACIYAWHTSTFAHTFYIYVDIHTHLRSKHVQIHVRMRVHTQIHA